jgi:hypothetical protein
MQEIVIYLRAGDVAATVVDEFNQTGKAVPAITRGMRANLCLRLLDSEGEPFQASKLAFNSWDFVLAHDWNTATPVQIRSQVGITVSSITIDEKTFSQINIPLTETNTEELIAALGNSSSIKLGGELAGFESGEVDPGFLIQFDMTVRNRRGTAGTDVPTPVLNGTYSIAQIDDLLAGKADVDHTHPRDQWVSEEFTLTLADISAKEVTLANTPSDNNALTFKIIGGIEQYEGIDFSITDTTVSWAGHALDGVLAEGDVLRVKYFITTENP